MKVQDSHWLIKAHINVVEDSFTAVKNEEGVKLNSNEYDILSMNKTYSAIWQNFGERWDKTWERKINHQPIAKPRID